MVVNINGKKSHHIIEQAVTVLTNLTHRGARGTEPNTGDGAGIIMQLPHAFLQKKAERHNFSLPEPGKYAVGMIFLPPDSNHRRVIEMHFETIIASEGQRVLGWRTVKTNNSALGDTAKRAEPKMRMVFIARNPHIADGYGVRAQTVFLFANAPKMKSATGACLKAASFSTSPAFPIKRLIYKGMLVSNQLKGYFLDLSDPDMESAMALVHSRFSTNTFPSWERAHPYRYVMHNGEINTLRGNINWLRAQENYLESTVFGKEIKKALPIHAARRQ